MGIDPPKPPSIFERQSLSNLHDFYLYQWLDVLNSRNIWLEGQIIYIDQNKLEIAYKGLNNENNEYILSKDYNNRIKELNTKTKALKKYEFQLQLNMNLDCLDSMNKWQEATIIDVSSCGRLLLINYAALTDQYNEWINIDSYRLAPLNKFTKPRFFINNNIMKRNICNNYDNIGVVNNLIDKEARFRVILKRINGHIFDMANDGNCLFRSISHQVYGSAEYHDIVRSKCVDYIECESEYFKSWVADETFEQYIIRMRQNGTWGDHMELQAMSEIYERPINIYAYRKEPFKVINPTSSNPPICLSYHFSSHYNSVVFPFSGNNVLKTEPGQIESMKINFNKNSLLPNNSSLDIRIIRNALEESRNLMKTTYNKELDEAIKLSLETLNEEDEKTPDEVAYKVNETDIEKSEDEILQAALKMSCETDVNEKDLMERALAASENDFINLLPEAVRILHKDFQIPLVQAQEAYAICNENNISNDYLLQKMLAYLNDFR